MLSDIDDVPICQPVGIGELFVDKRAVFALQVNKNKPVTNRVDLRMMPGHGHVLDDKIVFFLPADP